MNEYPIRTQLQLAMKLLEVGRMPTRAAVAVAKEEMEPWREIPMNVLVPVAHVRAPPWTEPDDLGTLFLSDRQHERFASLQRADATDHVLDVRGGGPPSEELARELFAPREEEQDVGSGERPLAEIRRVIGDETEPLLRKVDGVDAQRVGSQRSVRFVQKDPVRQPRRLAMLRRCSRANAV